MLLTEHVMPRTLVGGAWVDGRLWLLADGGELSVLRDGDRGTPTSVPVWEAPGGRGRAISRMGNHVVVAGEDRRVYVLATVDGHHGRPLAKPRLVGSVLVDGAVEAIAGFPGGWYAISGDELLEFDAGDPALPVLGARRPLSVTARAVAATPERIYLLEPSHLRVVDRGGAGESSLSLDAGAAAALAVSGRILHVAAGDAGLISMQDRSARAQQFGVTVGNNFFSPQSLTVEVGDSVRWNSAAFGGFHNVQSCTVEQAGCDGVAAAESFTSGPAAPSPWIYTYTFTQVGSNPYVCVVHVPGMTGTVDVLAPPPPPVPGGAEGPPLTVGKQLSDGSSLSLSWDVDSCPGAAGYHLIVGRADELPASPGATYEPSGSVCALGTPPFDWHGVPAADPAPDGWVWWLVVADDGVATEGPWGPGRDGVERAGVGDDGVSTFCGMTAKDLTSDCGTN